MTGQRSEDRYSVKLLLTPTLRSDQYGLNTVCVSLNVFRIGGRFRMFGTTAASNIKARATPCLYQRESVWTMKLEKHPVEILILRDLPRGHLAVYSSRVGVW
jgi:hypothetical protein